MRAIPEEVAAFARDELGGALEFHFAGWPHAESRIWRAQKPNGEAFYVKHHAKPYLFSRHLFACQHWVPHLPVNVPELVATSDPELRTLIFSEVPGQVMEGLALPKELELEAYRQAGVAASALHALPHEAPSGYDAAAEFGAALLACCELAHGLLPESTLDWALSIGADAASLRGLPLVPCHRDLSPRNWLIDVRQGRPHFSLIDFERARPDLALYELQRMWLDHFRQDPARRRAFFEGYGRALSSRDEFNLRLLVLRTSISTVCWARQNGDADFERRARDWIEDSRRTL